MIFAQTAWFSRGRRKMPALVALLFVVLVGMLSLGPVTPASTSNAVMIDFVALWLGTPADGEERPDDPAADLINQLMSQLQQLQEEEEDLHHGEPAWVVLPFESSMPLVHGPLVASGDDMSPRLSRPPRA